MALIPSLSRRFIGHDIPTAKEEKDRLEKQAIKIEDLREKKGKLPKIEMNLNPLPEGFMPKV
jgi:hypothetical protein